MKSSFTSTRTRILAVLLALCAIGIFAIAGTWYAQAHSTQSASTKQSTSTEVLQTKPPKATCGTVNARAGEPPVVFNGQVATGAEACFWQTYQQCQAKTLVFHQMGVDTGVNNTLWPIKQKGKCHIADQVSYYSVPVRSGNHSSFTTCTTLRKTQQGLLLAGCGKNVNLLVPAPTSAS